MKPNNNLSIILAPFSIGGPNIAAKEGPEALIKAGIIKDLKELSFKIKVVKPERKIIKLALTAEKRKSHPKNKIKNIEELIKINSWLSKTVSGEIKKNRIPVIIGGDHSLAIGTIGGVINSLTSVGVLWIDRHFDAHSPKNTPSWRAHGMPVSVAIANDKFDLHEDFKRLLKIGFEGKKIKLPKVKPQNVVQIAIGEKSRINPPTRWYSVECIDEAGIQKVINQSIDYLLKRVKYVYIAWDIDSLNVTGTGTSGDEQLSLREGLIIARAINKKIRMKNRLAGFEMMEVAPSLERKDLKGQTVEYALKLISTSFGDNLFTNFAKMTRNINMHAVGSM